MKRCFSRAVQISWGCTMTALCSQRVARSIGPYFADRDKWLSQDRTWYENLQNVHRDSKYVEKLGTWDHKGDIEGVRSNESLFFCSLYDNFDSWIEEEEHKHHTKGSKLVKEFYELVDLEKHRMEKCRCCGGIMTGHDIKYGSWCLMKSLYMSWELLVMCVLMLLKNLHQHIQPIILFL